jgi:hypothetical protein
LEALELITYIEVVVSIGTSLTGTTNVMRKNNLAGIYELVLKF